MQKATSSHRGAFRLEKASNLRGREERIIRREGGVLKRGRGPKLKGPGEN